LNLGHSVHFHVVSSLIEWVAHFVHLRHALQRHNENVASLREVTLGLEEQNNTGGPGVAEAMRTLNGLEVIAAEGQEVEFKLNCGENGFLHERSIFKEDPKWGYIYVGESVFQKKS